MDLILHTHSPIHETAGFFEADHTKRRSQVRTFRHDHNQDGSLSDDHVNAVYVDRDQVVWVVINNNVCLYNPLFSPFVKHSFRDQQPDI